MPALLQQFQVGGGLFGLIAPVAAVGKALYYLIGGYALNLSLLELCKWAKSRLCCFTLSLV
ncbi:hypothetical protein RS9916_31842 [Synechococcus sp. RS9916]|nr:hypothetical protein RS9916_31842 [Synechococcus sp. RS9916]